MAINNNIGHINKLEVINPVIAKNIEELITTVKANTRSFFSKFLLTISIVGILFLILESADKSHALKRLKDTVKKVKTEDSTSAKMKATYELGIQILEINKITPWSVNEDIKYKTHLKKPKNFLPSLINSRINNLITTSVCEEMWDLTELAKDKERYDYSLSLTKMNLQEAQKAVIPWQLETGKEILFPEVERLKEMNQFKHMFFKLSIQLRENPKVPGHIIVKEFLESLPTEQRELFPQDKIDKFISISNKTIREFPYHFILAREPDNRQESLKATFPLEIQNSIKPALINKIKTNINNLEKEINELQNQKGFSNAATNLQKALSEYKQKMEYSLIQTNLAEIFGKDLQNPEFIKNDLAIYLGVSYSMIENKKIQNFSIRYSNFLDIEYLEKDVNKICKINPKKAILLSDLLRKLDPKVKIISKIWSLNEHLFSIGMTALPFASLIEKSYLRTRKYITFEHKKDLLKCAFTMALGFGADHLDENCGKFIPLIYQAMKSDHKNFMAFYNWAKKKPRDWESIDTFITELHKPSRHLIEKD